MDIYFILTSRNIQLRASVTIKTMLIYNYHHSWSFQISGKHVSHFSNIEETEFGLFWATKKRLISSSLYREKSHSMTFVRQYLFFDMNAVLYWLCPLTVTPWAHLARGISFFKPIQDFFMKQKKKPNRGGGSFWDFQIENSLIFSYFRET